MIDEIPDDQINNIPGAAIQVRTYDATYDPVTQGFVNARMRDGSKWVFGYFLNAEFLF